MSWFSVKETEEERRCLKRASEIFLSVGNGEFTTYAIKIYIRSKLYSEGFGENEVDYAIYKIF